MDLNEYNKVKNLNYLEYCDYLQNKSGNEVYIYRENEYKFYDKKRKILLANHFCFLCHVWIGNHITLEVPNDEYKNTVQSISRRNYCLSCKKQKEIR